VDTAVVLADGGLISVAVGAGAGPGGVPTNGLRATVTRGSPQELGLVSYLDDPGRVEVFQCLGWSKVDLLSVDASVPRSTSLTHRAGYTAGIWKFRGHLLHQRGPGERLREQREEGGSTNGGYECGLTVFADAGVFPALSPPRSLRVNGVLATANQVIAPTPPVVSWQAPASGTARQYALVVRELTRSGTTVRASTTGLFNTTQTSLTLPPGVVALGGSYVFFVVARDGSGDLERHPLASSVPSSYCSWPLARTSISKGMATLTLHASW
jgi:hypothetical protein